MLENSKTVKIRNRRVVNGISVRDHWDWIVRLEFLTDDGDLSSLCGGTVIHRNFILTAAHCCIGKDSVTMNFKENKCKYDIKSRKYSEFFEKSYRNFISKDKSRRNLEKEEFQLRSRLFFIYPEYNKVEGAQNFDICLIKTAADEYGVHLDLSSKLDAIPCLPDEIDLKKVQSFIRLHTFELFNSRLL